MNKNSKKKKKKKGFTLIELIIVLAIMAIIAAIAIPNFAAVRDNSKDKADAQSCQTIKRAILMVVADGTIKGDNSKAVSFASGSITKDKDGNYTGITFTDGSTNAWNDNEKNALVEAIKEVKAPQGKIISGWNADNTATYDKSKTAMKYQVTIDTNGNVTVTTLDK